MMIDRKITNEGARIDTEMMIDMTPTTGEIKRDTEMTDKTTANGEVRRDTGMVIDMKIATEGVKRDTEMMIDTTPTAGEIKREMVRKDREVPTRITTNFQDRRRTPRISIRVTTPLQ